MGFDGLSSRSLREPLLIPQHRHASNVLPLPCRGRFKPTGCQP
jgi:hypothetical protein